MPSWDIHARVAEILGVDPRRQNEVDRLVDTVFHDIGRRMPHEYIFEDKKVAKMFERFEQRIVERVRSDPEFRLMFALHHATDILGYVLPSVESLRSRGIPVDVRLAAEVRLRNDLLVIERNVGASLGHVIDMILYNLDRIIEAVSPWTARVLKERERYIRRMPLTPASAAQIKRHVHRRAMLASNLLDYLIVHYNGPIWLLASIIASGSVRRATPLHDALKGVCRRLEHLENIVFTAVEDIMVEETVSSIKHYVSLEMYDDNVFVAVDEGIIERLATEYAKLYVRYCLYYALAASRRSDDQQRIYSTIFWNCFCKITLEELMRLRSLPEEGSIEIPLDEMLREVRAQTS